LIKFVKFKSFNMAFVDVLLRILSTLKIKKILISFK